MLLIDLFEVNYGICVARVCSTSLYICKIGLQEATKIRFVNMGVTYKEITFLTWINKFLGIFIMQRSVRRGISQGCALCKCSHNGYQCDKNMHAVCSLEHLHSHFFTLFEAGNTEHANALFCG